MADKDSNVVVLSESLEAYAIRNRVRQNNKKVVDEMAEKIGMAGDDLIDQCRKFLEGDQRKKKPS